MNKNYTILSTALFAVSFGMASCSNPEPEIVESNYAYTIDESKTTVEMPDVFDYSDEVVAQFAGGHKVIDFPATVTPASSFLPGQNNIELSLVSNKPLGAKASFTLEADESKTEEFASKYEGYRRLNLSDIIIPESIVIDAGASEGQAVIAIKEDLSFLDFTKEEKGYYIVLHLRSSNPETVKVGANGSLVTVLVTPTYTNIIPEETAQTDPKLTGLKVFDGLPEDKSWSSTKWADLFDGFRETGHTFYLYNVPELYVTVDLGKATNLSGFILAPFEQWGQVVYPATGSLYTSEDGENFKLQGNWSIGRSLKTAEDVASFKLFAPVKARYVKVTFVTNYSSLGEIEFYGAGAE